MKVAVIGCGGIGAAHARTYDQLDEVAALTCLDLDRARAEELAGRFGADAGVFPDDLPDDLDAASVVTPPHAHFAVVKELLTRGIPTFCEKPMTLTAAEGDELIALAGDRNMPLMVGFKMRFEPVFQRAKQVLPRIGDLYGVSATKCQPHHDRPGADWVLKVGAMSELASHDLDLVNWLTGLRPTRIAAKLHRNEGWTGDTRFTLNIEYAGGVTGQFLGGYCEQTHFCYRDIAMTFLGRNGYIRVERPNRIVCHLDKLDVIELGEVDTNTFPGELRNFLQVVRGQAEPFITAEQANMVTRTIEAARQSDAAGEPVTL